MVQNKAVSPTKSHLATTMLKATLSLVEIPLYPRLAVEENVRQDTTYHTLMTRSSGKLAIGFLHVQIISPGK